jgi:predicted metalloprotease
MEWKGREESKNVEDRRGFPKAGLAVGGGIGAIILALIAAFVFKDPQALQNLLQNGPAQQGQPGDNKPDPAQEESKKFVGVVLKDTENVWEDIFPKEFKMQYEKPPLVLYTAATETGCGTGEAAMGPFYCPADNKVYLDLNFFQELKNNLKSPGEFAQAYVIAHEVGHHVQHMLGNDRVVDKARRDGRDKVEVNQLSVCLELQADYLAGVWAHYAQEKFKYLDINDLKSAVNAASNIGDDKLQAKAGRRVRPESFTHGSADQRVEWFTKGFKTGDVKRIKAGEGGTGDTFSKLLGSN